MPATASPRSSAAILRAIWAMLSSRKVRAEVCLFDTNRDEVVWLTSSWSCVTHSGSLGDDTSCFQLCGYDDYCAKQVNCTAPDVDLLLCAMGVCLPEPKAGIH